MGEGKGKPWPKQKESAASKAPTGFVSQSKKTKSSYYHFEFARTVFPFWDNIDSIYEGGAEYNETTVAVGDEYYGIEKDGGYIDGMQFSIGLGSIDASLNMLFGQTKYIGYGLNNDIYSYLGASFKLYLKRTFWELGYVVGIDEDDEEFAINW